MKQIQKVLLTLTLVGLTMSLYGQKNTIKGFFWPPVLMGQYRFGSLAIAYERNLTNNKSLNFILNTWGYGQIKQTALFDNPVLYNNYFYGNLLIDFRKYLTKQDNEKSFINNCYGSLYSIFSINEVTSEGGCKNFEGACYSGMHFGLGIATGKKIYLTKNNKIILDIGLGAAATYYIYSSFARGPVASRINKDPEFKLLPRGIFLLGYNF